MDSCALVKIKVIKQTALILSEILSVISTSLYLTHSILPLLQVYTSCKSMKDSNIMHTWSHALRRGCAKFYIFFLSDDSIGDMIWRCGAVISDCLTLHMFPE